MRQFIEQHLTELLAVVLWVAPSPLTSLLKGKWTMQTILFAVKKFIVLVTLVVVLVEDFAGPGDGAAKKVKAIEDLKVQLPALAEGVGLPAWAIGLLVNDQVLGLVIDAVVALANASGAFPKAAPVDPQQAETAQG